MTAGAEPIEIEAFRAVEVRAGTVLEARDFPEARQPLCRLRIDFGEETGVLRSAARLAPRYELDELEGRQVLAVVNLPPRPIAGFTSECLTLGLPDAEGEPILVVPERPVPDGGRLY